MRIKFLKNDSNSAFVRPSGYTFPVGLSMQGNATLSVDYLIVAGGGYGSGGGGGAGGLLTGTAYSVNAGSSYPVTVGAGGSSSAPSAGSNSTFNSPSITTALGGEIGRAHV